MTTAKARWAWVSVGLVAGLLLVGCGGGDGGSAGDLLRSLPKPEGEIQYVYISLETVRSVEEMKKTFAPEGEAWDRGIGQPFKMVGLSRDDVLNARAFATVRGGKSLTDRTDLIVLVADAAKVKQFRGKVKESEFTVKKEGDVEILTKEGAMFAYVGDKVLICTNEAYMTQVVKALKGNREGAALADHDGIKPLLGQMPSGVMVHLSTRPGKAQIPGRPDVKAESSCLIATKMTNDLMEGKIIARFNSPEEAKKAEEAVRKKMEEDEKAKKLIKNCSVSGSLLVVTAAGNPKEMRDD